MKDWGLWRVALVLGALFTPSRAVAQTDASVVPPVDASVVSPVDTSATPETDTQALRRFVQQQGPLRLHRMCANAGQSAALRAWCADPRSVDPTTLLAQETRAPLSSSAASEGGVVPQRAIADVLMRGQEQSLVARASAELQDAVIERIRDEVCPDADAACSLREAPHDRAQEWPSMRNALTGTCAHACDTITPDELRACWNERLRAGCFYDGTCSAVQTCAPSSDTEETAAGRRHGCLQCLHDQQSARLDEKAHRCMRAVLTTSLASHTCSLFDRNGVFAPTFGNAFRAAAANDIVELPSNALRVLRAPLGVTITAGPRAQLLSVLSLAAVDRVMHATSPAHVGRDLRDLVSTWRCTDDDPRCAETKRELLCGLEVLVDGAHLARPPAVPEAVAEGVLGRVLTSQVCRDAGITAVDEAHEELLLALVGALSSATQDLRRLNGAASTPATADDVGSVPTPTATDPAVQSLARALVEAVNVSIRLGSAHPERPACQIPEGVPAFVGAIAARDVPAALTLGLGLTRAMLDPHPDTLERAALRAPSGVVRVLSFGADLTSAHTLDAAEAALAAFAAPVQGWRGKHVRRMFSLAGMVGFGVAADTTLDAPQILGNDPFPMIPIVGMVGMDLTWPIAHSFFGYGGLFFSVLDVGALVSTVSETPRLQGPGTVATQKLHPLQFIAPGVFGHVNLFGSPLNLMLGVQYFPYARTLAYTVWDRSMAEFNVSSVRLLAVFSVDITILPF